MERLVGEFIHVSDLHFGNINDKTLDSKVLPYFQGCLPVIFDGLLGHGYRQIVKLDEFVSSRVDELGEDGVKTKLIVTGDLTAFGGLGHFKIGEDYLGDKLKLPKGRGDIGLKFSDWKDLAVPGNHDNWPGIAFPFGSATSALQSTLLRMPISGKVVDLVNNRRLRFIGINTDADVDPYSAHRFLARGSFKSEIYRLRSALPAIPSKEEIRIILLHHSLSYRSSSPLRAMEIDKESLEDLESFIQDYHVKVILSGHIHETSISIYPIKRAAKAYSIFEVQCGTTSQLNSLPKDPKQFNVVRRDSINFNSLVLHQIYEIENSKIEWRSTEYTLKQAGDFQHSSHNKKGSITL